MEGRIKLTYCVECLKDLDQLVETELLLTDILSEKMNSDQGMVTTKKWLTSILFANEVGKYVVGGKTNRL